MVIQELPSQSTAIIFFINYFLILFGADVYESCLVLKYERVVYSIEILCLYHVHDTTHHSPMRNILLKN